MDEARIDALIAAARTQGRIALDEIDSKQLLAAAAIATIPAQAADSVETATALASRIGFPVALKVLSPDVLHKSDVGGIALGLRSEAEIAAAFERIRRELAAHMPQARFSGVSVQAMAPAGVEMIVGVARDDRFGPLVTVGIGGILVEVMRDTVTRLAPVTELQARSMITELRAAAVLEGVRGSPPADIGALAAIVAALSRFSEARPEIREMDLNPVAVHRRGATILDARVILSDREAGSANPDPRRVGRIENLKRAFKPRSVAVIGDKRANSYLWLRSNLQLDGKLYSVQIDPHEIAGIRELGVENHGSLAELPEPIDYAISAVPRQVAPRILRDCIAARVGALSFFTSGFSETGEEPGVRLEEELRRLALESDIAIVGPNCMGLCTPAAGLLNYPGLAKNDGGDVCFISQSGTHTINFCLQAASRRIAVNQAASIGNATILEAADYLDVMADDPATRVIGLYIEGVRDGRRFFESLRRAAARHPVVLWKGGVTNAGARAALSHTASLQTPAAIWQAIARQSGAVEAASMDAVLDAIELFARGRRPLGRRMGLVAMTGGQSVVITDSFAAAGLEIPALSPSSYDELKSFFNIIGGSYRNPLDAGGTIDTGIHTDYLERILAILERDPVIDAIVLEVATGLRGAAWASRENELIALLDKLAAFNQRAAKPLTVILHPAHIATIVARAQELARERRLVVFEGFERAARALRTVSDYWAGRQSRG